MAVSVTCGSMMIYILPMMLGRTYDMQTSTVGIDIFNQTDIDKAINKAERSSKVESQYIIVDKSSERRNFLDISGELALKISAGLVNVKGAGQYLKDVSKTERTVELLVKMQFKTLTQEIDTTAKPLDYWRQLKRDNVGTHVVSSLVYGGEVYASVNFIAHKDEYLQDIKVEVNAAFKKEGAFDIDATGKLENLAKNISSKAKLEIDYFATVPVSNVPTSIEDLKLLISEFKGHVMNVNNGNGVAICAGLRPLSEFESRFQFLKNKELESAFREFNSKFDDLIEAKAILKSLIKSLAESVDQAYLDKVIDFSNRLTSALMAFHKVVGELDLEKGSEQLEPALLAFDTNSKYPGRLRYTMEVKKLKEKMVEKDDPQKPRGTYTRWGKRSCGPKASNLLYIGFMSSFNEDDSPSAGIEYQCLPENPDMSIDLEVTGDSGSTSMLTAVRYRNLSVFEMEGKKVENKVASCVVCESYLRPTVQMFPASISCPGDWIEEYNGFIVSNIRSGPKSEHVCLDVDPDFYESSSEISKSDPVILPIKMGHKGFDSNIYTKDASLPCVVCSK